MVNAFVVKEAHYLFHDHHSETEHTDHCGTDTHFHTLEHDFIDCFICAVTFSPKENAEVYLPNKIAPECNYALSPYQVQPYVQSIYTLPSLRAPPTS